jgi:hypothetical protein
VYLNVPTALGIIADVQWLVNKCGCGVNPARRDDLVMDWYFGFSPCAIVYTL